MGNPILSFYFIPCSTF